MSSKTPLWTIDRLEAIYLSSTNMCNLKCIMCPNRNMNAERGMMHWAMFERLIGELGEIRKRDTSALSELHLSNDGEPFLHPDYMKMLREVDKKVSGINVFVSTNGLLLNKQLIDELFFLRNNHYYVVFSLDASYRALYEMIRVGGDFEATEQNVRYFLTKKQSLNVYNPYVVLQFIVMDCNRHDQHEFYWKWEPYLGPHEKSNIMMWWHGLTDYNGAHVFWKQLAAGWAHHVVVPYNRQTEKRTNDTLFLHQERSFVVGEPRVCAWPWRKVSIGWDGGVGFCCMHWELYGVMGNLCDGSLTDIFEGTEATKYRFQFWNGCYRDIPICGACDKRDWWHDEKFEETLKALYSRGPNC